MATVRACMYPAGSTANEKRAIRQQADMFVLKERLLYNRATDAVGEISLKRVIANEMDKAKIIFACHDGVDGCHYGRDKTCAKVSYCIYRPMYLLRLITRSYYKRASVQATLHGNETLLYNYPYMPRHAYYTVKA